MGDAQTLAISNNVVSRKKLIGIANFIKTESEAKFLSKGSKILGTEQEIRDTKQAQVLLPLLSEIVDVKELLKQAKAGGIQLVEGELNEFIVKLANEKATKPLIWRPRDGETISANTLFDRYKEGFEVSAVVAKDRAFYETVYYQGVVGVPIAKGIAAADKKLKSKVVKVVTLKGDAAATDAEIKSDAILFTNQIRRERAKLKAVRDKFTQMRFSNKDFAIVINSIHEVYLENDARYNMYTEKVQTASGVLAGDLDGSPIIVSKQNNANIAAQIQLFGAATSLFALRQKMNADKTIGVEAYAASIEFDEGTGVWLPHMITFIVESTDTTTGGVPAQDRVTFDDLVLTMNKAETTSGNAGNTDGLNDTAKGSNDEAIIFDAATFQGSVVALTGAERAELKTLFGLAADAPNAALQAKVDAR